MHADKAAPRAHGGIALQSVSLSLLKTYPVWNRFADEDLTASIFLWALGVGFPAFFVGLLVSGILLRYGLGAENLVWSLMFIIQPLGRVSYSVAARPGWLQPICWALCRQPMFSRACAAC